MINSSSTPTRTLVAIVLLPLLIAGLGAACGSDEESGGPTGSPSVTTTRSPASTATPEPTPTSTIEPFEGGREPIERSDSMAPPVAIHVGVETSEHGNFDRAVFEFQEKLPGYRIEYVDPPIVRDASGEEVTIDGTAFIQIRFTTAQAHDESGNSTYEGAREIKPGSPAFLELENTGDFEGYVTWVIGLPEELDFRVTDTTEPFRIFVEVAHP